MPPVDLKGPLSGRMEEIWKEPQLPWKQQHQQQLLRRGLSFDPETLATCLPLHPLADNVLGASKLEILRDWLETVNVAQAAQRGAFQGRGLGPQGLQAQRSLPPFSSQFQGLHSATASPHLLLSEMEDAWGRDEHWMAVPTPGDDDGLRGSASIELRAREPLSGETCAAHTTSGAGEAFEWLGMEREEGRQVTDAGSAFAGEPRERHFTPAVCAGLPTDQSKEEVEEPRTAGISLKRDPQRQDRTCCPHKAKRAREGQSAAPGGQGQGCFGGGEGNALEVAGAANGLCNADSWQSEGRDVQTVEISVDLQQAFETERPTTGQAGEDHNMQSTVPVELTVLNALGHAKRRKVGGPTRGEGDPFAYASYPGRVDGLPSGLAPAKWDGLNAAFPSEPAAEQMHLGRAQLVTRQSNTGECAQHSAENASPNEGPRTSLDCMVQFSLLPQARGQAHSFAIPKIFRTLGA